MLITCVAAADPRVLGWRGVAAGLWREFYNYNDDDNSHCSNNDNSYDNLGKVNWSNGCICSSRSSIMIVLVIVGLRVKVL